MSLPDNNPLQLGEFLEVEGEVTTDVDNSGFAMSVTAGDNGVAQAALDVMLQPGEPNIKATRIISKTGGLLDYTAITAPRMVQVDGVLDMTSSETMLKAALVIIDIATEESEQITGTVISVGTTGFVLSPEEDTVCGITTTDLSVSYADEVDFLTVSITDTISEISPGGVLEVGQDVGINDHCSAEGYVAENIVILDDQRTP
jgi:hypothetical protein